MIENLSLVGARAAGVPGTVLGMWEAHQRFGKLPWSELITPAVGYAREGFTVADQQFQYREDAIGLFNGTTNFEDYFGSMRPGATFRRRSWPRRWNASPTRVRTTSTKARPPHCWSRRWSAMAG